MSDRVQATHLSDRQTEVLAAIALVLGGVLGAFLWPIPDATEFVTGPPLPGQTIGMRERISVDCGTALSSDGGSDCDDNRQKPRLILAGMFIGGIVLGTRSQMQTDDG